MEVIFMNISQVITDRIEERVELSSDEKEIIKYQRPRGQTLWFSEYQNI